MQPHACAFVLLSAAVAAGCASRAVGVDGMNDGSADANLNNNSGSSCETGTCDGCCDRA